MDTASRHGRLHQYGFACGCEACRSQSSDDQRVRAGGHLQQLEQALSGSQPAAGQTGAAEELVRKAEELAWYVEEQGFADYGVKTSRLAYEFAMRAGHAARARTWAEKHLAWQQLVDPTSVDAQRAQQMVNGVPHGSHV